MEVCVLACLIATVAAVPVGTGADQPAVAGMPNAIEAGMMDSVMNAPVPHVGPGSSAPHAAVPPKHAVSQVAMEGNTYVQMETQPLHESLPIDVITEFGRRSFSYTRSANCRNRATIMSTFLKHYTAVNCQNKCASDATCTGYTIEVGRTSDEGSECTIFRGQCEIVNDGTHDLYLVPGPTGVRNTVPEIPAPVPEKPRMAMPAFSPYDNSVLNITIVSPTVRRFQNDGTPAPERYLAPMVQKILQDLTQSQRVNVKFIILNCDKEPEKHVEALSLKKFPEVTVINKAKQENEIMAQLIDKGAVHADGEAQLEDGRKVNAEWMKWVASEDIDGAYLLEKAMAESPYVLFLEDDVWPTSDALVKLTKFVRSMKDDNWLFVDLYTPALDWAPGMLDFQNGEKYNFQCCTQAMLFRSDRLPGIIDYWRSHSSEPVDDNLRNYRKEFTPDLYVYATRPNLFEHVGAYSSNPQKSTGVVEHQSVEFYPLLFQIDANTETPETVRIM